MELKGSIFYVPHQVLGKRGISFADFAKKKHYYNQLAFLFEEASSRTPFTQKETAFLMRVAHLYGPKQLKSFLDAPCGTGRHARILSRKGFSVTGIDASSALLKVARARDKKTRYKKADLRNFTLEKKFDCIFSLWESYNYLSRDRDLNSFLRTCAKHLNPGGILVLDSRNFWQERTPKKKVQQRTFQNKDYVGELVIRKRTLLKERVHEGVFIHFILHKKTGVQHLVVDQELVRIWPPHDIVEMSKGKFRLLNIYGDFDVKQTYKKKCSPRMILVLQRV